MGSTLTVTAAAFNQGFTHVRQESEGTALSSMARGGESRQNSERPFGVLRTLTAP
jgi:hypothetical protein